MKSAKPSNPQKPVILEELNLLDPSSNSRSFSEVCTYTGVTTISTGKLTLGATGSISNSSIIRIAAGAALDTMAKATFVLPASQVFDIGLAGAGIGSSGRINAAGLDLTNAVVTFRVSGTLDDAAYVLASYTSRIGSAFASVTPPPGYTINYGYAAGTQIALVQNTSVQRLALVQSSSTYESWASNQAITGTSFTDDTDGDGLANGIEYAIGGNPNAFTPRASLVATGSNQTLNFAKSSMAAADPTINYVFEISSDLNVWIEVPPTTEDGSSVSYTLTSGQAQKFVRLKIKRLP